MRIDLDRIKDFPTLPAAAYEVMRLSLQPEVPIQEMADIILKDVGLSTRILRTVNSAYYPLNRSVTNITEALVILGLQTVKNITLSLSVMESFQRHLDRNSYNYLQSRALNTAVAAEAIADDTRLVPGEDAFLVGLLGSLGLFLLAHLAPKEFGGCMDEAKGRGIDIATAALESLQVDHVELGLALAERWHLSDPIKDAIRYHAKPEEAQEAGLPDDRFAHVVVAHLGHLAAEIYTGWGKSLRIEWFKQGYRRYLNREEAQAEEMLGRLSELIAKAAAGFDVSVPPPRSYAHILEEANAELGRINLQYEQMYRELMAKAAELDRMNKELNQLTEELDRKNRALSEMAARDGLTELYNHRYFQDFAAQQFRQARRYGRALSLIMLDIDHFKRINDAHGHQSGDLVLKELGAILVRSVRKADIIGRYGGEEFAVIMPDTDIGGALVVAEKIRSTVEGHRTRTAAGIPVAFTVSIGTAQLSGLIREPGDLIAAADQNLYRAKRSGRNCVCGSE